MSRARCVPPGGCKLSKALDADGAAMWPVRTAPPGSTGTAEINRIEAVDGLNEKERKLTFS